MAADVPIWMRALLLSFAVPGCGSQSSAIIPVREDANGMSSSGGSGSSSSGNASDGGTTSSGGDNSSSSAGAGSSGGAGDASSGGSSGASRGSTNDSGSGGGSSGGSASGSSSGSLSTGDGGTCGGGVLGGGPIATTTVHLDIGVHDPSMIWDGSKYYLFATNTLGYRSSADMLTWTDAGNWLVAVPGWVTTATGATGLWAPDISYFAGSFHVYYAGSTFGKNTSVIGLSTTTMLQSPSWVDQGLIVQSTSTDNFNAIDPNVSFDQSCTPWLAFGSFWSGIKMRKLDAATGKLAADDTTLYSLASRPTNGGAIEASSIVSHNGYYYLFVSFDACCKGITSTYNTNVGRATNITGPYSNKAGTPMTNGGSDLLLATSGRYIGPGGGTAWKDGNTYLYAFHYYDGQDGGRSKLQVRTIDFDANDWVTLGNPLFP